MDSTFIGLGSDQAEYQDINGLSKKQGRISVLTEVLNGVLNG
jgi:hypothetical protein